MKDYNALFETSYGRIAGDPDEHRDFLVRFYENFAAASPDIAARFSSTDMTRQRRMLARSIEEIVEFSSSRVASEYLRDVARRHSKDQRDVPPPLYDLWLDCLLATAREFCPGFNDETELAWRVVMAPGIAYMKFRYDRY